MNLGELMSDKTPPPLAEVSFSVPGMMCDGCAESVRNAAMAVPGVRQARSSAWRRRVTVRFEPSRAGPVEIRAALASSGFETVEVRA